MNSALAIREPDDLQIVHLDSARRALELATTASEIKNFYDLATNAVILAERQKCSEAVIDAAYWLRIQALIKLGHLLKATERNTGTAGLGRPLGGSDRELPKDAPPTLTDLGLDKKTSMIAQRLADMPTALQSRVATREVTITRAILEHRRATAIRPRLPDGIFRVILADPPWAYGSGSRSGSDHYDTMSIDEIAAMDVQSRAADNSVLFLWTTGPLLYACEPVFRSWGFVYKAEIVWDKDRGIPGSYVNVAHEFLLICTRGYCVPDRLTPAFDSVQTFQRSNVHSQKPDEFYGIIERLYDGPYLELFARRPRAGWTSFGNELLDEAVA